MFHLSMYIGNHCHDCYLPDSEAWTGDITIPQTVTGFDRDLVMHLRTLDNCCYLQPDSTLSWDDEPRHGERQIQDRKIVRLSGRNGTLTIVPDQCTAEATTMRKYRTPGREIIRIGREKGCQVCQRSEFMSDFHGELQSVSEREGYYTDHSKNGSFVNGTRYQNQRVTLRYGDVISMGLGLRIVWLGSVVAINSAPYLEHVNLPVCVPTKAPDTTALSKVPHTATSVGQYHRAPRILQTSEVRVIKIEPPLAKSDPAETPLILTIGPSATMMLPMILSSIVGGRSMGSLIIMMGGSAMLAVMWGMINFDYRKKQRGITEEKRQSLYHRYIAEQEEELMSIAEQELSRMNEQYLSVDRCLELPVSNTHRLWERMATHSDFGTVRLGRGQVRLPAKIEIPEDKLAMIEDDLRDEPRRLLEAYENINDAPIVMQLRDWPIIGVLSPRNRPQMLQSMVMQLAATHSYHDVHIAILCKEENITQWSWARWLPHSFANENRTLRMVVSKPNAIHEVITYLENILFVRKELAGDNNGGDNAAEQQLPHYFIFCTDPAIIENLPIMRHLMEGQLGFTLVLQASSMEQLPKECRIIIQAGEQQGAVYSERGDITNVFYEYPSLDSLVRFSHQIAPIRVKDSTGSSAIPSLVTFMEIYHARSVDELDVWRFWSEHHAWEGIQSTIGLRAGSQPFVLDISDKQQSHGPHGLVAGTTGSGKSVMLQTYILSLALNYHPSQVQFILIDYKGGGTANVFKDLPHVAGIIDNQQEERTIQRALKSIQGEINRRERIFKRLGIDHIDDYIQYYNNDPAEKPLAHIIIVVDEFAELKHEQPEFMKALVSAARVGRSVGLHLILATQKPSNSVDDEIWSNTRFHICLRVASRADSNDMLKRPDAAYLRGMGRCYVQVGNDEIFEQVQTSYSGAEYNPDALTSEEMPHLLNDAGQPLRVKKKQHRAETEKAVTQMDAVMDRIIAVAKQHGVTQTPQLWLDEMASIIPLEKLEGFAASAFDGQHWHNQDADTLLIPYAMMDDVAAQCYVPMSINLSADHNVMIVAPAASGKTTMIQTLAMSLAMLYTPDQVNLYIFSLTSNTLGVLRDLPHVGEIVMANEADEISRLLQLIISEDNRRRTLFEELNTSNFAQYNVAARKSSGYEPLPAVVVMVDRFAQLLELLKDDQLKALQKLLMEAASHGIYFIVTALSLAKEEMPFKMVSAFRGIGFQLPDRDLYKQVLGVNSYISPDQMDISAVPGRGLGMIRSGNDVGSGICEVQAAIFGGISEDFERSELIAATAARMDQAWTGARPRGIVRIPKDFRMQHMLEMPNCRPADHPANLLSLAVRKAEGRPVLYDLAKQSVLSIIGAPRSGKTNTALVIAEMVCQQGGQVFLFGLNNALQAFAEAHAEHVSFHSSTDADGCYNAVMAVKDLLHERSDALGQLPKGDAAARAAFTASLKPIAVIIDDVPSYIENNPQTLKWLAGAASNSMGMGMGILFAITCAHQDVGRMRPREPFNAICNHPIGIALGGRLNECMPWNISVNFELKKLVCPMGEALFINGTQVEQIVVPLLDE